MGNSFLKHGLQGAARSFLKRTLLKASETSSALEEAGDGFMENVFGPGEAPHGGTGTGPLFDVSSAVSFPSLRKVGDGFMREFFLGYAQAEGYSEVWDLGLGALKEAGDGFMENFCQGSYGGQLSITFDLSALAIAGDNFMREFSSTTVSQPSFPFQNSGSSAYYPFSLPSLRRAGSFFMAGVRRSGNLANSTSSSCSFLPEINSEAAFGDSFMEEAYASGSSTFASPQGVFSVPESFGGTFGKNFLKGLFKNKTGTSAAFLSGLPEPDPLKVTAEPEGFMEGAYQGCVPRTASAPIVALDRDLFFSKTSRSSTTERASQHYAPAGSSLCYTDGTPVTVPADGTTAEGIPSNFYG